MTTKKRAAKRRPATGAKKGAGLDVPSLFRINVEVGNIDQAADFYRKLLGLEGRKQAGSSATGARLTGLRSRPV